MRLYTFIIISILFFSLFTPSKAQNTTDVIVLLRAPLPESHDYKHSFEEYLIYSMKSIDGSCYACGEKISILALIETKYTYNPGSPDLPNLISISLSWPSFLLYDSFESLCSRTINDNIVESLCSRTINDYIGPADVTTDYSSDTNSMTLKVSNLDVSSALLIRINFTILCQNISSDSIIGITCIQDNYQLYTEDCGTSIQNESMITFDNITNILNCDDGNLCTFDQALPSVPNYCPKTCNHIPITCTGNPLCTNSYCDPQIGCLYPPISCDDNDNCTSDSCDFNFGCVHKYIDGCYPLTPCSLDQDCDDKNACTSEFCFNGTCKTEAVNCDDSDYCTIEFCDKQIGCNYTTLHSCYHSYFQDYQKNDRHWLSIEVILGIILECIVFLGLGLFVGYKATKPKYPM